MNKIYRTGTIRVTDEMKEDRKVQFIISDDTRDRYGTVMNMDNWDLENFNANGIVGYQHDVYGGGMCSGPDPDTVIGKGRAWIEQANGRASDGSSKVLVGEVEFEPENVNELAEKIYRKVLNGTLKATSVGFIPKGGGTLVDEKTGNEIDMKRAPSNIAEHETFYFNGQELLEFSVVNIPANPKALKRGLRDQTANALQFVKRELGAEWSYGDIEQMRVKDVIKMLEMPKEERNIKDFEGETEEESNEQPDYGLRKLTIRKHKLENKKAII